MWTNADTKSANIFLRENHFKYSQQQLDYEQGINISINSHDKIPQIESRMLFQTKTDKL